MRDRHLHDPRLNLALKVIGEHTCVVTVDQDGGVEIPDWQRKCVGTQDHVSLLGAVRMIKIYDPKKLEEEEKKHESSLPQF